MTALAVLAVTAALAVLLAVLSHLAWPPVVVAILGTVPALYLAWAALPGAILPPEPGAVKKPAYGRLARRWDPVELGVHQVIGGGPMPAYVRRPHDELLRAVLDPAVPASRLVVVRGGSSTGKTRAAYEAVAARLADWRLDYPLDPGALAARLEAGIPARTVLWLGELRQYADAEGGTAVLGHLADLLEGEGHMVITTMWPEHWDTYTAAARAGPGAADPAGVAGRLLARLPQLTGRDPAGINPARGGVIDVPDRFAAADLEAAARTSNPLLAEAAAAAASAGQDGQVTQYLAGVPDLLRRYDGPGGDPYGQAVITAAMDATRLGRASPLPAALVQDAAVGYLTASQRTKDMASWRDPALAWAAAELNGAVRALQPVPHAAGTGVAGYQVADYLDQHGRRTRQDQLGPASLWDALIAHATSARDLTILAQAARDRGLYRHAAALWTTAATLGSTDAARQLIIHLRRVSPGDTTRAAHWAVGHVSLDDPWAVAELLRALREAGAHDAVTTLAARAAGHVSLDNLRAVTLLLQALREAGAPDAVTALLARDPAGHASLDDPRAIEGLLRELRAAGAHNAVTTLAARAAGHVSLDNPGAIEGLLGELRAAGADNAVTALLARDPVGHASLDDPRGVAALLRALRRAGARDAVTALLARAAGQSRLDNPQGVAWLLGELRRAGAGDAMTTLLARDPVGQARLDDLHGVAWLLGELSEAGAGNAVTALATRAAGQALLDDPRDIAELLRALRGAGAPDAVTTLILAVGLLRGEAGPATRSPPWPPGPRARPASTTREASLSCCGSCAQPGSPTRSPPWPPGPRATSASTTRGPSPSCCGSCAQPGPPTRSPPWPPGPRARPASTTRRASPSCCGSWVRPGPTTRSPSWPPGPPTRACSIFPSRSALTRPPATRSGANQMEPHRKPGNGKSRPARTAVCTLAWLCFETKAQLSVCPGTQKAPDAGEARPGPTETVRCSGAARVPTAWASACTLPRRT